jgi:hypothetical protein
MQNPAILNIPLFKQYLENNGIPYWKLRPEEVQEIVQGANAMGGAQTANPQGDKLMNMVDTE